MLNNMRYMLQMLDRSRHVVLDKNDWNEEEVVSVIEDIFNRAISSFNESSYWPTDPNEDASLKCNKSFYFGASGVLWSLDQVATFLKRDFPLNKVQIINNIHRDYLREPDTEEVVPSLFLGEVGILLLKYKFSPDQKTENCLYDLILNNITNETLEPLWGAPGTMIGATYMYEWTQNKKWSELFEKNAVFLIQELKKCIERGENTWTQKMYGQERKYIGAGHGYFGNIFGILRNYKLLQDSDQEFILNHIAKVTKDLALEKNGYANWFAIYPATENLKPMVQWCHGSPGVITSLHLFPKTRDAKVEDLLLKAGELVWAAGPLLKGVALCHGTDGNGFSFLQLYKRSGDITWLDRARQFAMYALKQRNGRFSLFTGELGLALYLISCLNEDDRFPLLDYL
jgi:hypothetical protein